MKKLIAPIAIILIALLSACGNSDQTELSLGYKISHSIDENPNIKIPDRIKDKDSYKVLPNQFREKLEAAPHLLSQYNESDSGFKKRLAIAAGFKNTITDEEFAALQIPIKNEESNESSEKTEIKQVKEIINAEDKKLEYLDILHIKKAEYTSLQDMVYGFKSDLKEGSEYLSLQPKESAIPTLADATVHYVTYFEDDIRKRGMMKPFMKWQKTAYQLYRESAAIGKTEAYHKLHKEYINQLDEIASQI